MRRHLIAACFVASVLLGTTATPPARADGGVNTGLPGSTCAANDGGLAYAPPTNGERTAGLGAGAPAYYEIGPPTGAFAGQRAKGVVLVIHGGGWHLVGPATVRYERPQADAWRARGWATVNLDYRACAQSWTDVLWFMQRVRQLLPNAVICAQGESAGAHLALLLASVRTDLACVVALAGPSDLVATSQQLAYDPRVGQPTSAGPTRLYNLARAAFGGANLAKASPIRYAARTKARLLLASGAEDPMVAVEQNNDYAAAVRAANPSAYVDVDVLAAGTAPFVHTTVDAAALEDLAARELALVAPLVR